MGAAQAVRTWTYDGVVPGYTWELRGGDVLAVDLHNHRPKLAARQHMTMDRPHEWTTTNLHTHGLHVSPSGIADNVFLEIPPGDRQRHKIPIPHDHPAGLFWYHPHKHGGVCQQVRGGMAGIVVIRGDLDRVPEIRAAREQIMVLQSIELGLGRYNLVLTPGSSQKPNIPGIPESITESESELFCRLIGANDSMGTMPAAGLADEPPELQPRTILTVEVRGSGRRMHLPRSLPAWDPPMLPVARRRRFEFTVSRDPMNEFLAFGIDGKQFDLRNEPYRAKLNTAEEWTLVNACDSKLKDHAHVYHVHVNPFMITAINGRALSTPLWRDTFVLTKRSGDSLTFVSNFVDFSGKSVEHCHVLAHEDLGMMASVEVVK